MYSILLIDDNIVDAKLIHDKIINNNKNVSVDIVHDKTNFFEFIKEKTYSIVLADYKIEIDFTAEDIINYMKGNNLNSPIIIITGAIGEENAADLMRVGATDLIKKDNTQKLCQVIDRELSSYVAEQNYIHTIEKANTILFKIAKLVNWILQNPLENFSFEKLMQDFKLILGVDRSYILKRKIDSQTNEVYYCPIVCSDTDPCKCEIPTDNLIFKTIEQGNEIYGHKSEFEGEIFDFLDYHNIYSFLCVPILNTDKSIWGIFGFDNCLHEHKWSELEINTLKMLGAIIGTVIHIKKLKEKENSLIDEQISVLRSANNTIMDYIGDTKRI